MRKIAVDFDGTLVDHRTIPTRRKWWLDKPKKFALESIWSIAKDNDVYVLTSRPQNDWQIIDQWLYNHGFPMLEVTNVKQKDTEVIIDDRAIRFTNWLDISKLW